MGRYERKGRKEKTKTIGENVLKKRCPLIQWNWGKMDTRVVDAVTEQFSRVALDFPYAVRLLRYVGISHNPKFFKDVRGGQPWAATVMDGKGLLLNSRWYENDKKMRNDLRRTQSDGFHPDGSDTLGFPIAHEMGHLVYDWIKTLRRIGLQGGAKPISQLAICSSI